MTRAQVLIIAALVTVLSIPGYSTAQEYPEAKATANPNVVISPFPPNKEIDVSSFLPGDLARDPHSGNIFRVPPKRSKPLVVRPEIIEEPEPEPEVRRPEIVVDDPPVDPGEEEVIVRRPEIIEGPVPEDPTLPRPPAVPVGTEDDPVPPAIVENPTDPAIPTTPPAPEIITPPTESDDPSTPAVAESDPVPLPILPERDPRKIDIALSDFIETFVRSGQNNNPEVQGQFLAPNLREYFSLGTTTREEAISERREFHSTWVRRIYLVSGKPKFVRWLSAEGQEDEFEIDVKIYRSIKNKSGSTKRGYVDHRYTIRQKADGSYEITGVEEGHSSLASG